MVDVKHKKGGIVETNLRTISSIVYESQNYIKKPSFLHWVSNQTMNQTKQHYKDKPNIYLAYLNYLCNYKPHIFQLFC